MTVNVSPLYEMGLTPLGVDKFGMYKISSGMTALIGLFMRISVSLLISQHRVLMEELSRSKKDFEEIIKAKDRELKETKVLNRRFIIVENIGDSDLARKLPTPLKKLLFSITRKPCDSCSETEGIFFTSELEEDTNTGLNEPMGACRFLLLSKTPFSTS